MKPKSALMLAIAAAALPALLAAQNTAPAPEGNAPAITTYKTLDGKTNKIITVTVTRYPTCPVSMQAEHGSGSGLVMVRHTDPQEEHSLNQDKPGQQIHLILGKIPGGAFGDRLQQLASASVTITGLSARGRVDRTPALFGNPPSDLKRTQRVTFAMDSDGRLFSDLNLPGFTSVQSIRIESLDLKDGSKWTISNLEQCVVAPNPLMLVAAQ